MRTDVEILEAHHRNKKDAPSGTALRLCEVVATRSPRSRARRRHGSHGHHGERPRNKIGVQVVRGGDVVGEHT